MKKQIISISVLALGFIAGASALSAFAQTWTAPTATPPNGNVPAPINVGSLGQAKTGLLALANFVFNPTGVVGSVAPGQVLTAVDNAGTVGWGSAAASSGVPSSMVVIDSSQTWTVPAGVTKIRVRAWGAGGAGGGGSGHVGPGAGGAGGGYGESVMAVTPGTVYPITIGTGGVPVAGLPGGNGGNTTFSSITAFGGTGGENDGQADSYPPIRAAGGASTGAQIAIKGGSGSAGGDHSINPYGGSAAMGGPGGAGGTNDGQTAGTGGDGQIPGGGGGGAASNTTPGGNGGHGRVVIEY